MSGGYLCRSALKSGYLCGNIDATGATRNVDGHSITNLKRTDFDAIPGDSGGPYFLVETAYGLHADSLDGVDPPASGHSWYTTVNRADTEAGTSICLTSSC